MIFEFCLLKPKKNDKKTLIRGKKIKIEAKDYCYAVLEMMKKYPDGRFISGNNDIIK